jgi:hypothetical protein
VRIRAIRPGLKVLFVSGYAPPAGLGEPFLPKPFTPNELLDAVRRVIVSEHSPGKKDDQVRTGWGAAAEWIRQLVRENLTHLAGRDSILRLEFPISLVPKRSAIHHPQLLHGSPDQGGCHAHGFAWA